MCCHSSERKYCVHAHTHTHNTHTHTQAGYMRFGSVLPFNYTEEGRVLRAALYSHKSVDFPKKGSGN